jgi:predicted dehydrogenase
MRMVTAALAQLAPLARVRPLVLARAAEEHGGPHNAWFWDPTRQGGGVLCDMGCHSIALAWYALTPPGKPPRFLVPESVLAETSLLKWGQPAFRDELLARHGVDYARTPAEDFATGLIRFRNPETGQRVSGQFTVSWMYDKQGLRLLLDGIGPGYALEANSLRSPLEVFVSDAAAESVRDAELALEKAQATRGLLAVQPNEPDLYGYTDENVDAAAAFEAGRSALLDFAYGAEIVRLVMAAYLSAERGARVELEDPATQAELERYVPLIQQGRGGEVLLRG